MARNPGARPARERHDQPRAGSAWTLCVLLVFVTTGTLGQEKRASPPHSYPDKPIRVLVGNAPGGGSDITARILTQKLTEAFGRNVIVENRAGASGIIAMDLAAQATADGYSLLVVAGGDLASAFVQKKVSYDVRRAFAPITQITSQYYLLLSSPQLAAKTVKELIAYAKSKPGTLSFGSSGMGSTGHAGLESLKSAAGVDIVHVPYKGIAPALADMAAGQLHLAFASTISGLPHVRSGRLRALAVTSPARAPAHPDLPAMSETVPGFELTNWYGLFAPAGTPPAVVSTLHRVSTEAIKSADVQSRIAAGGAEAAPSPSPAAFKRLLDEEVARWQKIVRLPGFAESLR